MNSLLQIAVALTLANQPEASLPKPRAEFATEERTVRLLTFSADGKRLAVVAAKYKAPTLRGALWSILSKGIETNGGYYSYRLTAWDSKTGKRFAELEPSVGAEVCALSFSPDAHSLAVGAVGSMGHRRFVSLWDLSGPKPKEKATYHWDDGQGGLTVAFSADGKTLVAAGGAARVWDLTADKEEPVVLRRDKEVMQNAALSPDGKRLATVAFDPWKADKSGGAVRIWDVATSKETTAVEVGEFAAFAPEFSAKGKTLTYWTLVPSKQKDEYSIRKWTFDVGAGGPPVVGEARKVNADELGLTFTNGTIGIEMGKLRFVAEENGEVVVRDLLAGKQLARFNPGHGKKAPTLQLSPDGMTLATASDRVRLWDVAELLKQVDAKESVAVQAAMIRWANETKKENDPVRQIKVVVIQLTAARDAAVGVSRFYVRVPHDAVGRYPPEVMAGEVRVLVRE